LLVKDGIINEIVPFKTELSATDLLKDTTTKEVVPPKLETPAVDLSDLRYATFGTSITWGATLGNRTEAYPYLLSPNVANYAIRASGPNYPSVCTQSMLGDNIYDVITLEFFMDVDDGLVPLVRRLRRRFPEATIILIRLWTPDIFVHRDEKNQVVHVHRWAKEQGVKNSNGRVDKAAVTSLMKNFKEKWFMRDLSDRINIQEKIAHEANAYIYEVDQLSPLTGEDKSDEIIEFLQKRIDIFSGDWFHYSQRGHKEMANKIKSILQGLKARRSDVVYPWDQEDACYNWHENGKCPFQTSQGVRMENFNYHNPDQPKFALHFPEGGSIKVNNPSSKAQNLVLTYMTTGPTASMYPKTKIQISSHNFSSMQSSEIDPLAKNYNHPVHVSSSQVVGVAFPGENFVFIRPLERSEAPFRLVSIAMISGDYELSNHFVPS